MRWIQVISYLRTNELRLLLGLFLAARGLEFGLERKVLLVAVLFYQVNRQRKIEGCKVKTETGENCKAERTK